MSLSGSPSKESFSGTNSSTGGEELPRDFSRLSLFSNTSNGSHDEHFHSEGHAENSLSCMRRYLQAGKLCDVVLIAGMNQRRVSAHSFTVHCILLDIQRCLEKHQTVL
ncbi:hypothetical protein FQA39_LY12771 [Lamprigera yunnana]|nr:hypothetical protein FQA39_LY12771 [Lamprigera yunnana]